MSAKVIKENPDIFNIFLFPSFNKKSKFPQCLKQVEVTPLKKLRMIKKKTIGQ